MVMPCPAYPCTHLTKYCAYAVRTWALSIMHPLSKAVPLKVQAVPLYEPLLVFIQVGGVQGLPQKRMLPLTACAALMYGMRYFRSCVSEKLVML